MMSEEGVLELLSEEEDEEGEDEEGEDSDEEGGSVGLGVGLGSSAKTGIASVKASAQVSSVVRIRRFNGMTSKVLCWIR